MRLKSIVFTLTAISIFSARVLAHTDDDNPAAKLEAFISETLTLNLSPGLAVAVVKEDEIIFLKGFGYADLENKQPVTEETMFYIASTSKSFTAFAAALQQHRGKLDLDASLQSFFPKLSMTPPLSADEITLRDLLTHTHGISDGGPIVFRTAFTGEHNPEQLLDLLSKYEPSDSGRKFRYGNLGYNLTGLAMDAKLGVGWKDVQMREIFKPLGLKHTNARLSEVDKNLLALPYSAAENGFRPIHYAKADDNMHAAGGHVSSASDLARWLLVHINSGQIDGKQIFPAEVVFETHRQQVEQERSYMEFRRHGWGLGWDIGTYEADTLLSRFGSFSGFFSHVSFMPEHNIGVVALTNGGQLSMFLTDLVARYTYDQFLGKPNLDSKYQELLNQYNSQAQKARQQIGADRARRAERSQNLEHPLTAFSGKYENNELGIMDWTTKDSGLEVSMGLLRSPAEVYDAQENQLRVELTGRGEVIKFTFENEKAISLSYSGRDFHRITD